MALFFNLMKTTTKIYSFNINKCLKSTFKSNNFLQRINFTRNIITQSERILIYKSSTRSYVFWCYPLMAFLTIVISINNASFYLGKRPLKGTQFNGSVFPVLNPDQLLAYNLMSNVFVIFLFLCMWRVRSTTMYNVEYVKSLQKFEGSKISSFGLVKKIIFDPTQVIVKADPNKGGMMLSLKGNMSINGKNYFFITKNFKEPLFYNAMTGLVPHTLLLKK